MFSQRHCGKHVLPCEIYNNPLSVWYDWGLLAFNSKPCLWQWQEGVTLLCPGGRGDTQHVQLAKELLDQNTHRLQYPSSPGSPAHCGVRTAAHLSTWEQIWSFTELRKQGPFFYGNLTFMLIWALRKQLFVLKWSCSSCKISPITWGTKGKELREVVKSWWLNKLLGSVLAVIFRLLQSQFKWKSEHVATVVCVERKLCALQLMVLSGVEWICTFVFAVSAVGVPWPWQGTAMEFYFSMLVLAHAAFILPHPWNGDITGREVQGWGGCLK